MEKMLVPAFSPFSAMFSKGFLYQTILCLNPLPDKSIAFSKWKVFQTTSHYCLLSHITIVKTMGSSERGMNLVAMTFINPRKEYWPNQRSPVLKSIMLPTELWGSTYDRWTDTWTDRQQ